MAATHSGAGKTTITLGILAALKQRGMVVQPFKCGPDFIDPTLHQMVCGRVSRNLDLKMCGPDFVRSSFIKHGRDAEALVVEGVMGLFDGGESSSAALARTLNLPVVLVVDTRSCAESIAAVVKGFETLDQKINLAGVILNRVGSPRHRQLLVDAIKRHCRTKVLGSIHRDAAFSIPERHLGLTMGEERPLDETQIARLSGAINDMGLDDLIAACPLPRPPAVESNQPIDPAPAAQKSCRIAIAMDQAFCFYYQDNLDILSAAGAKLIPFSPLKDKRLPPDINAVYLGGGYPELYAAELAANRKLLAAIREWSRAGGPLYAECGGFMYLTDGIWDLKDNFFPMAGVFPTETRMKKRLAALGYREAAVHDSRFWGQVTCLRGHEFHYSDITAMPEDVQRVYTLQDGRREGYMINNTLAGYLHLHWGATPTAAENFITFCRHHKPVFSHSS
ncbi:MAG TPA: cobyrinate a,c-diamide synthase [Desulfobacterales bacterium]|nr:cobyrinate a,c-diamide synthase [Desulfobacterales bacterium]